MWPRKERKFEERQDRERAHELEKLKIEKNAETERLRCEAETQKDIEKLRLEAEAKKQYVSK